MCYRPCATADFKHLPPSKAAAAAARALIQVQVPNDGYIDHRTGRIKSQATLPDFWVGQQLSQEWLDPSAFCTKAPAFTDPDADISDIMRSYTRTFVCQPLVSSICWFKLATAVPCNRCCWLVRSASKSSKQCMCINLSSLLTACFQVTHQDLRKQGDLTCPGCGEAGCLTGDGMRTGHVTVLELGQPQFRVFSYNIKHAGCSQRLLNKRSECLAGLLVTDKLDNSSNTEIVFANPGREGCVPAAMHVTCTHPTNLCLLTVPACR